MYCGSDAWAQVPQEPASEISSVPEQWQLTVDVIKSKAQTLMVVNNGLQVEHRQLIGQVQKLRQSIGVQQNKNEQMDHFLKERHGVTDQQILIEELTKGIKGKKQEARALDEQSENLKTKWVDLDRKIQQLNQTISNVENQQTQQQKTQTAQNTQQAPDENQLNGWRKKLEDESKQEVILGNDLAALKAGNNTQNLNVVELDQQNKQLEAQLEKLQLQKLRHFKKSSQELLAQENARKYDELKKRKDQLEADIYSYEYRLDQLRESYVTALSMPLKKTKLVHEMVVTDSRNNQMRDRIKALHEDIEVLSEQVARLERRLDFAQGKVTNQQ